MLRFLMIRVALWFSTPTADRALTCPQIGESNVWFGAASTASDNSYPRYC
jgi:hypothetical protein